MNICIKSPQRQTHRYAIASVLLLGVLSISACNNQPADSANMPADNSASSASLANAPMKGMATNGMNSKNPAAMKAKADMQAAQQRCNSMSGDAQTQCMQQAKAAYDAQMKSMTPQQ